MRKVFAVLGAFLLVWSLAIIGCSDDECATCPEFKQKAVAFGETRIGDGMLLFHSYIFGIDGLTPDVDSVLVDGHDADIEEGFGEGPGAVWVEYYGSANTLNSGDDIDIDFYLPTGTSSCTVTLLEEFVDNPVPIGWAVDWPYDTVDIGTEIVITWNDIPNADWYFFNYDYSYTDGLQHFYQDNDPIIMTDTTFTIPVSATGYNGNYSIGIFAVTGRSPNATSGNITGSVVKGIINSTLGGYFTIYVGDGHAWPVAPMTPETLYEDTLRVVEHMIKLHFDKLTQ